MNQKAITVAVCLYVMQYRHHECTLERHIHENGIWILYIEVFISFALRMQIKKQKQNEKPLAYLCSNFFRSCESTGK